MQALCGLQGIFALFNCKTPDSTSQPAPRFYLTRPLYEKPHTYFRADVPKEL